MQDERLADLKADGEHGVERGHRILKDHGDAIAANLPQLIRIQLQQVTAIKNDLTSHNLTGRRGNEPGQRHDADALATAAFADDGQGFPFIE